MRRTLTFRLFFIFLFSIFTFSLSAQRERNYIYLFDCTQSMIGYNGSKVVMPQTKDFLRKSINSLSDGTNISVVLFQDKVLGTYNFEKSGFDWGMLSEKIDEATAKKTNTNICDTWLKGESLINPNKDNYLILLTDGGDNVKGIPELVKVLENFCGRYNNTRGFYVKLTSEAIDLSKPGARELLNTIEKCPQAYLVDATNGIRTFFSIDMANASSNTLMLDKSLSASSSAMEKVKMHAVSNDPIFDVSIVGNESANGKLEIKVSPKDGNADVRELNNRISEVLGDTAGGDSQYMLKFEIVVDDKNFELCNPSQTVRISNKPERMVEFASMAEQEVKLPDVEYYAPFLFWSEKKLDTLRFDITPLFNSEAKKDNSHLKMLVADRDGLKDYTLLLNGEKVDGDKIKFDKNSGKSELGIVFNRDAKQGKRYFDFRFDDSKTQNLERVNTAEVKDASFALRTNYDVATNPLVWILSILGVLILVFLLLWFLILKGLYYPVIKVRTLTITSNKDFFDHLNIKGKRKVVLTDKRMSQGFFSKLFTGEIYYDVKEKWSVPFTITPKGKEIKIKYDAMCYDLETNLIRAGEELKAENTETKEKFIFKAE